MTVPPSSPESPTLETLLDELEMAHWAFVDAEYADDDAPSENWEKANTWLRSSREAVSQRFAELEAEIKRLKKKDKAFGYRREEFR